MFYSKKRCHRYSLRWLVCYYGDFFFLIVSWLCVNINDSGDIDSHMDTYSHKSFTFFWISFVGVHSCTMYLSMYCNCICIRIKYTETKHNFVLATPPRTCLYLQLIGWDGVSILSFFVFSPSVYSARFSLDSFTTTADNNMLLQTA